MISCQVEGVEGLLPSFSFLIIIIYLLFSSTRKLGVYNTPGEAFLAYKQAKEAYIKEVANKWKDQIDPRAYNALINYQVEITD